MADDQANAPVDGLKPLKVPTVWPGAMGSFRLVRPYVVKQIWTFVLLVVGFLILDIVLSLIFGRSFIGRLVEYVLSAILEGATITLYFSALKNKELPLEEAVKAGLQKFVNMFILLVAVSVLLAISFILLIVPFFFVLPRLILAPYLLIDQDLSFGDAISESWNLSKGNVGKIYGVIGLGIAIGLLCITIIGIPFAIYWGIINGGSVALLSQFVHQNSPAVPTPATT